MATDDILACAHLSRFFGALAAVDDLSFAVRRGEIFGISGPNGAGKTTLFNLLSGHVPASRGTIRFAGREIQGMPPHRVCHLGIARTFQIPLVFGSGTVAENALVGAYFGKRPGAFGLRFHADDRRRVDEALAVVGLAGKRDSEAGSLAVFDKKRLMIASALATEPSILLLDEPVGGLNHREIDEFVALIRRLREGGLTVMLIEHVMRALMSLSDRVMILHHGEKLAEGTPELIRRDPEVIRVYLGRDAAAEAEAGAA
jgi:branched-chain amino acid transport system ATP-binding protein